MGRFERHANVTADDTAAGVENHDCCPGSAFSGDPSTWIPEDVVEPTTAVVGERSIPPVDACRCMPDGLQGYYDNQTAMAAGVREQNLTAPTIARGNL